MYFAASFVMYFTEFEIKKIICEKYQYAIRNQIVIVIQKNKKWVSDMGMRWKYFEPGGGTRTGGKMEVAWKRSRRGQVDNSKSDVLVVLF